MQRFICLISLFAISIPAAADKLYKWVDDNGVTHYSDTPPPSASTHQTKEISTDLHPINRSENQQNTKALGKVFPKQSAAEQEFHRQKEQQHKQQQSKKDRLCAEAKRDLKTLKGPVYFKDDQGRSYTISEKKREQRAKALEKIIQQQCD